MSDVRRRKNMSDSTEGLSETSFEEAKKISDTVRINQNIAILKRTIMYPCNQCLGI